MGIFLEDRLVSEIESKAVEMAREAGKILQAQFGKPLEVEYKDREHRDPVTAADRESQLYLREAITRYFPDHDIVGEEGTDEADAPTSDFLWVLDPLDGTTNFVNGLPIYAVSIGVLHEGAFLAGSLFLPWPGEKDGLVLHARRGGGAYVGEEPFSIPQSEEPTPNRLTGLPASFGFRMRFRKNLRRRAGEIRVTGSIAYELALTARGVFQYVIMGAPRVWDVAAGALLVMEAGGSVLIGRQGGRRWEPLTSLGPTWEGRPPSFKEIRGWTAPLIASSAGLAPLVAANLQARYRLSARIAALMKKFGRRGS